MKKYLKKSNILFLGVILILTILIGLTSTIKGSDFLGIFFFILSFVYFFIFFAKYPDQVLSKIILSAFILRAGLAFVQRFLFSLPDSSKDAATFERIAWEAVEKWFYMEEKINFGGSYYYSEVISWFYCLFGRVPLMAQLLNVLLGALIVFIVYKITITLFENKKAARIAAGITAFFPTLNLYSAILMRETFIVFFLALSLYFFTKWLKKGEWISFLLSLIFVFISGIFHSAMILVALVYFFMFVFYRPLKKKWVFISKRFLIGGLLMIFVFSLFFENFNNKIPTPSEFNLEILEKTPRGRAMYLEGLNPDNYFDVVWQTPIRVTYFYLAPFPWQIREPLDLVGFADVFLYFILFIFFFKGLFVLMKKNKAAFLSFLFIFIIFSGVFAWGTSNYGTSLRHRQKIVFLLIILASYYLSAVNWRKLFPKKNVSKKAAYFTNTDSSLYNFRFGLMKKMKGNGYKVYACSKVTEKENVEKINRDFIFKKFNFRRGLDLMGGDLLYFLQVFLFCKKEKPNICHNFNIKPCIYATLGQRLAGVKNIYCTITGLGYTFSGKGILNKLAIFLYRFSLRFADKVIFQNSDDRKVFIDLGIINEEKSVLIKSSGVNTEKFSRQNINREIKEKFKEELNLSGKEITITLIARILKHKGVEEFIEAAKKIKNEYNDLNFLLIGPIDKENPSGISKEKIKKWEDQGIIKYLGRRNDIKELLFLSDIFVLPSYREGVSRALLEAGAMELPLVTTNVPGCREVVDDGVNGFLVKPQDSQDLAEKIIILIKKEDLRKSFGQASRSKVEREFSEEKVVNQTLKVYGIDNEEKDDSKNN
jgi:glycosyltransferase involved in cell wall biosynthesis